MFLHICALRPQKDLSTDRTAHMESCVSFLKHYCKYVIFVWQTYESVTESRSTRFDEGQSKTLV